MTRNIAEVLERGERLDCELPVHVSVAVRSVAM